MSWGFAAASSETPSSVGICLAAAAQILLTCPKRYIPEISSREFATAQRHLDPPRPAIAIVNHKVSHRVTSMHDCGCHTQYDNHYISP